MRLDKEFIFLTTALKLSQCSRPDTQITISIRMIVGNISNKYTSLGLSRLVWRCSVLVLWLVCPHLVFFAKLHGIVMFQIFMDFLSIM